MSFNDMTADCPGQKAANLHAMRATRDHAMRSGQQQAQVAGYRSRPAVPDGRDRLRERV